MATTTKNSQGNNEIVLTAYKNCDDVMLLWRTSVNGLKDQPIPQCLGFCIERQRKKENGTWDTIEILRNRVGFKDSDAQSLEADGSPITQPSNVWPYQRYDWTDHGANSGNVVKYRISAVSLPSGGILGITEMKSVCDSGWTDPIEVTAESGVGFSAFFNRGNVMSQYMARIMRKNGWKTTEIKERVKDLEEPVRRFLSGELRIEMLKLLDEAIEDPSLSFYAALYELNDAELIDQLKKLRSRAHIILSNGSDKSGDGNQIARGELKKAKVDVKDRLLASKGLGHNKFAVVAKTNSNKALKAWTGSTNWSSSGLCTQLNNGLLINNASIADLYLKQWNRLADAKSDFTDALVNANAKSPRTVSNADVWFTRVRNKSTKNKDTASDIQALIDLVNAAKEAIVYVMFQPGAEPLNSILKRSDIYVRGVVSTIAATTKEKFTLSGTDLEDKVIKTELIQPEGIVKDFAGWIEEVTRRTFLFPNQNPGVGHAITHAKMIVIDPHLDSCKVITGSHNFSISASEQNDENFIVIHGDKNLAEAYSVACMSTYEHYRWRAYVKEKTDAGEKIWSHLSDKTTWQKNYLKPNLTKHLNIWV